MQLCSTISLERPDNTCVTIHCQGDGNLETIGLLLYTHYSDSVKLMELLQYGDIVQLGKNIQETVYLSDGRHPAVEYPYMNSLLKSINPFIYWYNYILRKDGRWYVVYDHLYEGYLTDVFENEGISFIELKDKSLSSINGNPIHHIN